MTGTSAVAVDFQDMDLITARSGSVEINHIAKKRAVTELANKF